MFNLSYFVFDGTLKGSVLAAVIFGMFIFGACIVED